MKLFDFAREFVASLQQAASTNWWLEVNTRKPHCTYFFGPFHAPAEAEAARAGYLQDLQNEGAEGITVTLKRCRNPGEKTICYDD